MPSNGSSPARGQSAPVPDPDPRSRPLAAALLALEGLLLLVVAGVMFLLVSQGAIHGRFGTGLGVFLVLFAAGAGAAARSVMLKGRFGLGYGITWQFFQALVGASLLRGGLYWQGALALVLAVVVFVLLARLVGSTPLPGQDD